MTIRKPTILKALREAGIDPAVAEELAPEAKHLLEATSIDALSTVAHLLKQRLEMRKLSADLEVARREGGKAAEAAEKLGNQLDELLEQDRVLAPIESVYQNGFPRPHVVCSFGGGRHLLPVHPEVDIEDLVDLQPWDAVAVNVRERVVVGIVKVPGARDRAHGDVAQFNGWVDRVRGLARVQRAGHEESVVRLVDELRHDDMVNGDRLVLLRGDPGWALTRVGNSEPRGRFEVPIDRIHTTLDDLAGLEQVKLELLEAIHASLDPGSARFGLKAQRGVLLVSRPGMGKTALVRAIANHLKAMGKDSDLEVVLHVVPPGALRSMWHGEDARLVREELFGSIRARMEAPRTRPLFQLVAIDEAEASLGRRAGGNDGTPVLSAAQNDGSQSLLFEMDGLLPLRAPDHLPPAYVFMIGMSNRLDLIDPAFLRPDRMGNQVIQMPEPTLESAEGVCAVHLRHPDLPFYLDEKVITGLDAEQLRARVVRPALTRVFDRTVLRYATDTRADLEVRAGELMSNADFMQAADIARQQAARRHRYGLGVPAVRVDDLLEGLVGQAASAARQMAEHRPMLTRRLDLNVPITRVECVPQDELATTCATDA